MTEGPGESGALARTHPETVRAAWWAWRALSAARRGFRAGEGEVATVPALPGVPLVRPAALRGVLGVLRRRHATCLERAAVLQAWDAAHGVPRDLVIGVTAPSSGFRAHAWLDGEPSHGGDEFTELVRHSPRPPA